MVTHHRPRVASTEGGPHWQGKEVSGEGETLQSLPDLSPQGECGQGVEFSPFAILKRQLVSCP
jgi:hypothetical protein